MNKISRKRHTYTSKIIWTGNRGTGNKTYHGYARIWDMAADGKMIVSCSNDPLLGGDNSKYNPEDLLLSALSSCHILWYLHLCIEAGVVVLAYEDQPQASGELEPGGKGRFCQQPSGQKSLSVAAQIWKKPG